MKYMCRSLLQTHGEYGQDTPTSSTGLPHVCPFAVRRRTRERAFQYIIATSIPLFFLANLSWPSVMTPQPLVWLAQLLPTTSGINLMVRLNQMDASLAEVSHELITLTVLLLLYGSLATWRLLAKKGTEGIKS